MTAASRTPIDPMKKLILLLALILPLHAARYETTIQTLPVLNDGEAARLFDFTLHTDQARTLTAIHFDCSLSSDLSDIEEISILHLRQAGNRSYAKIKPEQNRLTLTQSMDFPKGGHKCRVLVRVKQGTNLLHRIGLQITGFDFADGQQLRIPRDKNYQPSRLAYRIHKRGDHNCHTFRIPAIAKAKDGTLLAVYDMRYNSSRDLQEHMDIGLSRSTDGGQTWSKPDPIMDMGTFGGKAQKENGCSDPGILVDQKTGEIFVTACWTHGKPGTHQWRGKGSEPGHDIHKSTQFMAVRSIDNGTSWSKPENWTRQLKAPAWHLFAPAPGNGITMQDGTLVMPTQGRDHNGLPFSNITWSKDHGKTWNVSSHARDNTTECAVAELSNGSLMLSMRDNRNRKLKGADNGRAVATTRNLGKTWSKHPADHGALPEPVCMASLISYKHPKGRHILFFSNPHNKHHRRDMTIQMSNDDGKTWPKKHHILLDQGGSYGYSSLVMIDEQTIGILYESSAADMTFQKIPLKDFIQ